MTNLQELQSQAATLEQEVAQIERDVKAYEADVRSLLWPFGRWLLPEDPKSLPDLREVYRVNTSGENG